MFSKDNELSVIEGFVLFTGGVEADKEGLCHEGYQEGPCTR